ncbi:MAG: radical SAM protein [Candidatus Omnitrophica bacterium]|nr:radical SAM protein [Candidatus Omnitrophota bacterium]
MKVLLINPQYKQNINKRCERYYIRSGSRWPHSSIKIKGTLPHYLPFPFSLAYSASLLKESFFDVYVIDAIALDISENELIGKINDIKPDLVFYEITTPTVEHDLLLAKMIKEICSLTIAIGGTHASVFASEILLKNEAVDFVLRGEFEESLLKLATSLNEKKNDFPLGVVFRDRGLIIDKGFSNPIEHLDALPFPLRDIFPSNEKPNPLVYWDGFCQHRPLVQMQSSRGCHYSCYFCLWNQVMYNDGKYRAFSPNRVVDEIQDSITRYGVKEVYFDDDNFTVDKKHALSICEEILRRNLKIKWSCMGDVINLTEEMLGIMGKSGCIGIKFGLESGSEKILKTIDKPIDIKKAKEIIKLCKKYGIKTQATFTLGLLGETIDDVKKTFRFANSLDIDCAQVSIATPFPGTEFFGIVEKQGLLKNIDWKRYDGKSTEITGFSHSERKEVEKLKKNFLVKWFSRKLLSPLWCMGHIRIMLRTLKGLKSSFLLKQIFAVIIDDSGNRE